MKKKKFKKPYVRLTIEVINVGTYAQILAGSPPVQPGGGSTGTVSVIPLIDDEEEEISGANRFDFFEETEIDTEN